MRTTATAAVNNVAVSGVPPAFTVDVRDQNSWSRPIAKMTRVPIIVTAFNKGTSETTDNAVIRSRPCVPAITRAASAAGSVAPESSDIGTALSSAILTSR
jgi:hypothetical protein